MVQVSAVTPAPVPGGGGWMADCVVLGCDGVGATFCTPTSRAIDADGPTDQNGITTLSGTIRAGGFSTGLWVMVRGNIATGACYCPGEPICLPITTVSPDIGSI